MNMPTLKVSLAVATVSLAAVNCQAQLAFFDSFDLNHTASWTVNTTGVGLSDANFFFDYSTVGIPSAPNSVAGSTIGLRLRANMYGGETAAFPSGVSVSPTGFSLTSGDYELRYDVWMNFNGPLPGGGSGSTQVTGAGIGTAGTTTQVAGGTIDSINFGATGDGGSSADYRAYAPAAQSGYADASGVFAAGGRNSSATYYAQFGGATPPAAQTALFPNQTGATAVGAAGFAWHDSVITKVGNTVTWSLDGLLLATVDLTAAGTLGGGNILFSQYDINAGISTDTNAPATSFGLVDNVRVTVVPEPTSGALLLLGVGCLAVVRRIRR